MSFTNLLGNPMRISVLSGTMGKSNKQSQKGPPMKAILRPGLVCILAFLASCSSYKLRNDTLAIPKGAVVRLAKVSFDYASWSVQESKHMNKWRAKEASWRNSITSGFTARARELKLHEGSGPHVGLTIRVVDLDPGSKAARYWVGLGAGVLSAKIDAGTYGGIEANGKISGGFFGGDFAAMVRELGVRVAEVAAKSRDESRSD